MVQSRALWQFGGNREQMWGMLRMRFFSMYHLIRCSFSPELLAPTLCSVASLQFSHSVVSDSLRPHGLQHARFPCPSPTPGACSNSCPSSWWCHPTISSSVVPFSCCLLSKHQGLFQWVISSHEVDKVLEFQLQHHSFQRLFRTAFL